MKSCEFCRLPANRPEGNFTCPYCGHAWNPAIAGGAVDQKAFEGVIRDNLSPEGIATVIAFLQPAAFYRPANEAAKQALRQVEWLADTLTEMLGVEEHNRLMEELGL